MTTAAIVDLSRLSPRLTLPTPSQFGAAGRMVATTPVVDAMLNQNAVVAVGVSGGKDSVAVALAVARHLDDIGHTGPRLLIHSDLGRVEWKDSLAACERLAARLGWELVVVKRSAGDMLARWQGRWQANLRRYAELECVKLILPWSTPSMRFCTSELKTAIITSALRKRYPGLDILNVTGIRRQESSNRAKMPVAAPMTGLQRKNATGYSWNAIIEWPLEHVLQEIADAGLALHEAYTLYGVSRVSCAFCLAGETEVVTRDGIRLISQLAGGTHELLIPALNAYNKTTTNGSFKAVEVREFGQQRLLRTELKTRARQLKVVFATPEHRWFVSAVSERGDACSVERTTSELRSGDKLKNLLAGRGRDFVEVPFATAQGFVFGDGTRPFGDRPATLSIYNNGKDDALLPYFAAHNIRRTTAGRMDIYGLPRTWKNLPDIRESRSFLMSWLAGYFAADGCVSKQGAARLDSSLRANIEFARDIAAICGVGYGAIRKTMRRGFYEEESAIYSLNLTPSDLPDWFFVIRAHRERVCALQATGRSGKHRLQWTVASVTETDRFETVYCAVVPGAQAFGLADSLMTGNCIMSAWADVRAATTCEDNRSLYISMVELEAASGFGFQGNRWLASVAPHWLSDELRARIDSAQEGAKTRVELEKLLPKHLHYVKGWPTGLPSAEEAEVIAHVRRGVAAVLGVEVKYTTGAEVLARYQQLLDAKAAKGGSAVDAEEAPAGESVDSVQFGGQMALEFA